MSRLQTKYVCQNCGIESTKWMGKCPECEAWDSFVEEVTVKEKAGGIGKSGGSGLGGGFGGGSGNSGRAIVASSGAPIPITQVEAIAHARLSSGIGEFDRVLGGGIVPGGLMLVGGDPGIGKSTLLNAGRRLYRVRQNVQRRRGNPQSCARFACLSFVYFR